MDEPAPAGLTFVASFEKLRMKELVSVSRSGAPRITPAGERLYDDAYHTLWDCLGERLWGDHFDDRAVVTAFVAACRDQVQELRDYFACTPEGRAESS